MTNNDKKYDELEERIAALEAAKDNAVLPGAGLVNPPLQTPNEYTGP